MASTRRRGHLQPAPGRRRIDAISGLAVRQGESWRPITTWQAACLLLTCSTGSHRPWQPGPGSEVHVRPVRQPWARACPMVWFVNRIPSNLARAILRKMPVCREAAWLASIVSTCAVGVGPRRGRILPVDLSTGGHLEQTTTTGRLRLTKRHTSSGQTPSVHPRCVSARIQ